MPDRSHSSAPITSRHRAAWAAAVILLSLAGCGDSTEVSPTPRLTSTAGLPVSSDVPPAATSAPPTGSDTLTPAPEATPSPGSTQVSSSDQMQQGYVPAGEFFMGSAAGDSLAEDDERPQHSVMLSAFWIDRTEVTNAQFAGFVAATGYQTMAERAGQGLVFKPAAGEWEPVSGADWQHPTGPDASVAGLEQYPVGHMSWSDAVAYCDWAGRRLPTEAEWEKAARGVDGRLYPWGDDEADGRLLNFADRHLEVDWADTDADDGYQFFAPVGTYPAGASPFGALDMAGNAWEWVADFFDAGYYARSPSADPPGPETGDERVLRGGSWWTSARDARATTRGEAGDFAYDVYGFRCAAPAD